MTGSGVPVTLALMARLELGRHVVLSVSLALSACAAGPDAQVDTDGSSGMADDGVVTTQNGATSNDPSATGSDPTATGAGASDDAGPTDTGGDEAPADSTGEPAGPIPCQAQQGAIVVERQGLFSDAVDTDAEIGVPPLPGGGFVGDPDGGGTVPFQCDIFAQDCPKGEKCNAWAFDGGGAWNGTRCVPVAENPGQPGDSCTVEVSGVSGLDDCDVGVMCFDVDIATNEGTCVENCSGNEADPVCETAGTACTISNDGALILCQPVCNPLADECLEGEGCYPVGDVLVCAPDASARGGGAGEPCNFVNACDAGLFCLVGGDVPGCPDGAGGCCSSFCTIGDDSPCMAGQVCAPTYPPGDAPAECLADVGQCVSPI